MGALVDVHRFGDAAEERVIVGKLISGLELRQWQSIGGIPIDFVGRCEDERRIRAMGPGRFKHGKRSVGVDREVGGWLAGGPIVRRLGCRMDDQGDLAPSACEDPLDSARIANVHIEMGVVREVALESSLHPTSRGLRTEEGSPGVVVYTPHVVAKIVKVPSCLRSDETGRTCDDDKAQCAYPVPGVRIERPRG